MGLCFGFMYRKLFKCMHISTPGIKINCQAPFDVSKLWHTYSFLRQHTDLKLYVA
jgi:hypothetical protein